MYGGSSASATLAWPGDWSGKDGRGFRARGRILNRARKITLPRAFGAASPATTRARRIIGGLERDILTRASPSILSYSGRGETGAGTLRLTNRSSILAHLRRPAA